MAEALVKAGRYQIVGELGRGSMGVVYQGFDPVIGRTVAIKTMLPEGLSPQEFEEYKARFQREAMAAGILAHPNIITVYDFGEDNGVLYLAMEFLEGKSLEKIVQEQIVLPVETILPIYDQVCGALDHAHRNKVVHRDVKPANIMILQNGLVKVTDFGIAKMMAMGMTQAGQILGTPNYMSPEQVKGRQIDGRSDIFSLGVILYELVTGEKPFGGQNITTVIYKIINENPIPPRELDASIHSGLSYVISKALAKNPDERYQTCRELADDLRNYKNLGNAVVPQSTVILKTPSAHYEPPEPARNTTYQPTPPRPLPPTAPPPRQAAMPTVDDIPIASGPDTYVSSPPVGPEKKSIPQIVWVLGALLILAILGGGAYFFVIAPQNKAANQQAAQTIPTGPVSNNSQASTTPPVTQTTPPVTTDSSTQVTLPPTKPVQTPARNNQVLPPPEPRAHTEGGRLGQLTVGSNVEGARISIDGKSDPSWVTPHTFTDLSAGGHNISISKDGYETFQQSITVDGGKSSNVMGALSTASGELDLETQPPGAEVIIDGKPYGPSPVHATLAPGNHSYTVKLPGAAPFENSFSISSGQLIRKKLSSSGGAATGIVEVRTIPPGVTVLADGSPMGSLTPTSFRLPVGTHTLVVTLSGYRPVQQQVTVSDGQTTPINITLTHQ